MSTLDEAFLLLERGDYLQAATLFKHVCKQQPTSKIAWRGLGKALMMMRKYKDATEAFSNIIYIDPNDGEGWFELAQASEMSRNVGAAIRSYRRAMENGMDPVVCLWGMARCHEMIHDVDGAKQIYEEMLEINPFDRSLYVKLANFAYQKQDYAEAAAYFSKALELEEGAEEWYRLGVCMYYVGQVHNAKICWNRCLELAPHHPEAQHALGRLIAEKIE